MTDTPLTILTIFHPEHWLGVPISDLKRFPHIRRDRRTVEQNRKDLADQRKLTISTEVFHGRPIANLGQSLNKFRRTWTDQAYEFSICLSDLVPRLFVYDEEVSQARYRIECRYNWAGDRNELDDKTVFALKARIANAKQISIRQLWLNPASSRVGTLPIPDVIAGAAEYANLMIGPYESTESLRQAPVQMLRKEEVWWIRY